MTETRVVPELLPCPFCGSKSRFGICQNTIVTVDDSGNKMQEVSNPDAGGEYVECTNNSCGATTMIIFPTMADAKPLLVEKWNRRAAAPKQEQPNAAPTVLKSVLSKDGKLLARFYDYGYFDKVMKLANLSTAPGSGGHYPKATDSQESPGGEHCREAARLCLCSYDKNPCPKAVAGKGRGASACEQNGVCQRVDFNSLPKLIIPGQKMNTAKTYWLIERNSKHLDMPPNESVMWFAERLCFAQGNKDRWTPHADKAMHFASKESAEAYPMDAYDPLPDITEHMDIQEDISKSPIMIETAPSITAAPTTGHKVWCKKFPDPFDEREPTGPCTCGAESITSQPPDLIKDTSALPFMPAFKRDKVDAGQTPETDAASFTQYDESIQRNRKFVAYEDCTKLERERDAARRELATMKHDYLRDIAAANNANTHLQDEVARLRTELARKT